MNSVLIIEDSPFDIDLLVAALEGTYNLHVAIDADKAFGVLESMIPDIILLDAMLPGMDGFEFLQILQSSEQTRHIPVIFTSGMDQVSDQIKGLNSGAVDYITKPFHTDIVKKRVSLHLELSTHKKHLEERIHQRTREIEHTRDSTVQAVAYLAESRDKTTGEHIFKTQQYTYVLASHIAQHHPHLLSSDEVPLLAQAAALHDIGKVSVPDAILTKNGPLTPEEWEIMKQHTVQGAEAISTTMMMIGSNALLEKAYEICLSHHEKYDGTGYPNGLRGSEIPMSGAIVALVDVYDALVSVRPYKGAFSHEEAVRIITQGDGRTSPGQFHPLVLQSFIDSEQEFASILKTFQIRTDQQTQTASLIV
ncbi:MAG: response regulator [Sphaerochaetaceae bacterium]|nr:response regulator [Sphaerochaetaceae bacterium]